MRPWEVLANQDMVNGQPGNEVIAATANGVKRDALDSGPGFAMGGATLHNIVGPTAAFKPTIWPGDVHFARPVHCGRRERKRSTHTSLRMMVGRPRDQDGAAPACTSIRGLKGCDVLNGQRRSEHNERHNHRPVGLSKRLSANA